MRLSPDPLSPESMLVFPMLFLYPLAAQSDFIKAVPEVDSIADHLAYILPPPWDSNQGEKPESEYSTMSHVDCYLETATGGLVKAGKRLPFLEILSGGKVEVVDELVKIYVVPTAKAAMWIKQVKQRGRVT
jgi:hypothetical protein